MVLWGLVKGREGKGRECGNCALTADCVSGMFKKWEGEGLGEFWFAMRLC